MFDSQELSITCVMQENQHLIVPNDCLFSSLTPKTPYNFMDPGIVRLEKCNLWNNTIKYIWARKRNIKTKRHFIAKDNYTLYPFARSYKSENGKIYNTCIVIVYNNKYAIVCTFKRLWQIVRYIVKEEVVIFNDNFFEVISKPIFVGTKWSLYYQSTNNKIHVTKHSNKLYGTKGLQKVEN